MKTIKYIIVLMALMFSATWGMAQNPKFTPSIFTPVDQVTLVVDVTGEGVAGETDCYIWIFSNPDAKDGDAAKPKKDGVVNGAWGNSGAGAKMTNVGANKWQFTFVGTELFGLTPSQLGSFGFLVKTKDGSKQSKDYKPYKFDALVFIPTMMRVFPAKVGAADAIQLNFDQTLATEVNDQRLVPEEVSVMVFDDAGALVGEKSFLLKLVGEQKWAASFIPTYSFAIAAGTKLSKFTYFFKGKIKDAVGADIPYQTAEIEVPFTQFK